MARRAELHCDELGTSGPTLVFLPGLGGTTRYWRNRVEDLATTHRVVLVDLLGFGRSPRPWTRYTIDRHLEALRPVLAERAPFALVGHSLGAVLSVAYAARWPDEVERLVLLGMPYFGSQERAIRYFRRSGTAERWIYSNFVLTALTCILTRRLFGWMLPRLLKGMPREVAEDLVQHTWLSSTTSLWEAIFRHDLVYDADRLHPALPVLCLHGDRDRTAPLEGLRRLSENRPAWTVQILPGVGHHPLLRMPALCRKAIADPLAALRSQPKGAS